MTDPYAARVLELEAEGLTTSDAQGAADVELGYIEERVGFLFDRRASEERRTADLIRALGGADAICKPGCTCRGSYAGPERRSDVDRRRPAGKGW